jgi:transposase-like protein
MADQEVIQQFITLRSRGVSFSRIADQLGVAKSTLVNWSRTHQHLIQNLRVMEWEEFVSQTLASKQDRLKALSDQLRVIETELAKRDLTTVNTAQLHALAEQLRRRIDHECGPTLFSAGTELYRDDESRKAVENWNA